MKQLVKHITAVSRDGNSAEHIYAVLDNGRLMLGTWYMARLSWQDITPDIDSPEKSPVESPGKLPPKRKDFFNSLSFVAEGTVNGKQIALLADEQGKRIPGQCGIRIGDPDQWGVREVLVRFEVKADIPEGCETSINM